MTKDLFNHFTKQRSGKERQIAFNRRKREVQRTSIQSSNDEDPRLAKAQEQLGLRLADYRNRNPALTAEAGRDMQKLTDDFRQTCMAQGIRLPKMRLVYFVRMNHVCVWPSELEHAELQKRLHLFITHRQRHSLPVDADDMAMGVRRAYPDYAPSRHLILPPSAQDTTQQETLQ